MLLPDSQLICGIIVGASLHHRGGRVWGAQLGYRKAEIDPTWP